MPEKKTEKDPTETKINEKRVLNILLTGNDKIYWYAGMADSEKPPLPTLYKSDFSKDGIRKILLQRNKIVFEKVESLNDEYTRGVLKMTDDFLAYRISELNKLVEEGKANQTEVDNKIKEVQKLYAAEDQDLLKEFLAWKIKDAKKNEDAKAPIILVKADEKAKYRNIVDIIDEMAICAIASYAVVDINDLELEMLASAQ